MFCNDQSWQLNEKEKKALNIILKYGDFSTTPFFQTAIMMVRPENWRTMEMMKMLLRMLAVSLLVAASFATDGNTNGLYCVIALHLERIAPV